MPICLLKNITVRNVNPTLTCPELKKKVRKRPGQADVRDSVIPQDRQMSGTLSFQCAMPPPPSDSLTDKCTDESMQDPTILQTTRTGNLLATRLARTTLSCGEWCSCADRAKTCLQSPAFSNDLRASSNSPHWAKTVRTQVDEISLCRCCPSL